MQPLNTKPEDCPPVLFFNTAHPDLENLYNVLALLSERYHRSVEEIHEGLVCSTIHCLADREAYQGELEHLEAALQEIEREYKAPLQILAQHCTLVLLCEIEQSADAIAALALLLAARGAAWPDIVCLQFEGDNPHEAGIVSFFPFSQHLKQYGLLQVTNDFQSGEKR